MAARSSNNTRHPASAATRAALAPQGPARAELAQDAVVHVLAALLGTQPSAVAAHAKFTDLGLDSLLAVAFTRRVKADLDITVTPAEVWAHPSPTALATHIESTLPT